MPSTVCSSCGGSDIEYDQARGDAVCTNCGCVLEDNIIVSEVSFAEQSSGASSVIGQFVSSEGSKVPLSGSGFHHGLGKVSREVTLAQAKKRLNNLGQMLRLNQHCIDSAFMFFKMALQLNLTRGRKSSVIDTACLYLVCRSEGTPHLLLDFSDVLQINVYSLGRAYMRLSDALHIHPPAIDPCLFIHRFAHKLEFGEMTHEVSMTALRLVSRMKRDWIHHGRRPAGLCGAALLVAARIHNFNRTVRQVARIVKLSEGTVRKRLGDFNNTASSRLTIDDFLKVDLEQEHDPPSYLMSKKKSRIKCDSKVAGEGDGADEDDDLEDDEDETWGFGGIRNESVDDIIAKAQYTEMFLNTGSNLGLSDDLTELVKLGEEEDDAEVASPKSDEGLLDCSGIDDKEIEAGCALSCHSSRADLALRLSGTQMLLSEEEVEIKSKLWFAENGDFLKERELKRERLEAEKAEKIKNKRTRAKRKPKPQYQQTFASASEAVSQMLVEKRISSKINYEVLKDLDVLLGEKTKEEKSSKDDEVEEEKEAASPAATKSSQSTSPLDGQSSDLTITRYPATNRLPSVNNRTRSSSMLGSSMLRGNLQAGSSKQPAGKNVNGSSDLPIKRYTPANRLPSLTTRKRPFSTLATMEDTTSHSSTSKTLGALGSSPKADLKKPRVDSQEPGRNEDEMHSSDEDRGNTSTQSGDVLVEESGPVQYFDEGDNMDEDEEGVDLDELEYPEDPLNNSDYDDYED